MNLLDSESWIVNGHYMHSTPAALETSKQLIILKPRSEKDIGGL